MNYTNTMNDQTGEGGILLRAADSLNYVMEYESLTHHLVTLDIYPFVETNSKCNGLDARFRLNRESRNTLWRCEKL
jgi:hypothetical protein